MTKLRKRMIVAMCGAAVVLLGACSSATQNGGTDTKDSSAANGNTQEGAASSDKGTIKIGLLIPKSGVFTDLGTYQEQGWRTYLALHDNKIGGYKVETVVADDAGKATVALQKTKQLVQKDHVNAVIGVISTDVALAVAPYLNSAKVPFISTNAGANELSRNKVYPYVVRTSDTNYQNGVALAKWFYNNLAKKDVAIIGENYTAGIEQLEGFKKGFEDLGGKISVDLRPALGTSNYVSYISKIVASKASAVFSVMGGSDAINFIKQWAQLKPGIPLAGCSGFTTQELLGAEKDAAIGIYSAAFYMPGLDNPLNKEFVAKYKELYKTLPGGVSVYTYNAGVILNKAIQGIGSSDPTGKTLAEALVNVGTVDTPQGELDFSPKTHNPAMEFYLARVEKVQGTVELVNKANLGKYADLGPGA